MVQAHAVWSALHVRASGIARAYGVGREAGLDDGSAAGAVAAGGVEEEHCIAGRIEYGTGRKQGGAERTAEQTGARSEWISWRHVGVHEKSRNWRRDCSRF